MQELFAAALCGVLDELDWPLLGELYCYEGGEHFFDAERRAAILDGGLAQAAEIGAALERFRTGDGLGVGASLYVGASVFELGPILFESLFLGRHVDARNLPGRESAELDRALVAVARGMDLTLPRISTTPVEAATGSFDHVWLVSVLTDPEAFPALHDELYGRHGTDLATGRGDLAGERARAEALVARLLAQAASPCLVTTTEDEEPIWRAVCPRQGRALAAPGPGRLSPVVGDAVHIWQLR